MTENAQRGDAGDRRLRARLRLRIRLAEAVLLWEEAWPALWPAVLISGTFLALALFDVLPMLPGWVHGLVLVAFAAFFAAALFHAWSRLRVPGRREAARRIELASDLRNRPLAALEDRPAGGELTPSQSELFVQAHGGKHAPRLKVGGASIEFAPLGADGYQARTTLRAPGKIAIEQNRTALAAWTFAVVPDRPPEISLKEKPAQSQRGALRLNFHAASA